MPPIISSAQTKTGIADIPNMVYIIESPVQPRNPNNIIRAGTPFAITIPSSSAPICLSPPSNEFYFYRSRRVQNNSLIKNLYNSEKHKIQRKTTLKQGMMNTHLFYPIY